MMSIGNTCKKVIKATHVSRQATKDIIEYCNAYAQKLLGNDQFQYSALPEEIANAVFNSTNIANMSWSKFIKQHVQSDLEKQGYKF